MSMQERMIENRKRAKEVGHNECDSRPIETEEISGDEKEEKDRISENGLYLGVRIKKLENAGKLKMHFFHDNREC